MTVTFVTSGGPRSGMGHIFEAVRLADAISDEIPVQFLLHRSESGSEIVESRGYPWARTADIQSLTDHVSRVADGTVVLDLPCAEPSLLETLQGKVDRRLVLFGNPGVNLPEDPGRWIDVLINYTVGVGENKSEHFTDDGTTVLRGPRYFPLRPEFRSVDYSKPTLPPRTTFLMFGGADPRGLTELALKSLGTEWERITVVVGPGKTGFEKVQRVTAERETVTLFHDIDDVAKKMNAHDLILTSPGASTFEALSLGRPTLAFYQNEAQQQAYNNVSFAHKSAKLERLPRLISVLDGDRYQGYRDSVGRGFDRVVARIRGGER